MSCGALCASDACFRLRSMHSKCPHLNTSFPAACDIVTSSYFARRLLKLVLLHAGAGLRRGRVGQPGSVHQGLWQLSALAQDERRACSSCAAAHSAQRHRQLVAAAAPRRKLARRRALQPCCACMQCPPFLGRRLLAHSLCIATDRLAEAWPASAQGRADVSSVVQRHDDYEEFEAGRMANL